MLGTPQRPSPHAARRSTATAPNRAPIAWLSAGLMAGPRPESGVRCFAVLRFACARVSVFNLINLRFKAWCASSTHGPLMANGRCSCSCCILSFPCMWRLGARWRRAIGRPISGSFVLVLDHASGARGKGKSGMYLISLFEKRRAEARGTYYVVCVCVCVCACLFVFLCGGGCTKLGNLPKEARWSCLMGCFKFAYQNR